MTIPDINLQIIDIPDTKIHEMVTPNEDGSYTIFINARLSAEEQNKAYEHALKHITDNDFEKDNVQMVEYATHGLTLRRNKKIGGKSLANSNRQI